MNDPREVVEWGNCKETYLVNPTGLASYGRDKHGINTREHGKHTASANSESSIS